LRVEDHSAHWLYPGACRCGPWGPVLLGQWLSCRRWLYGQRALRREHALWREVVAALWRCRRAIAHGDGALAQLALEQFRADVWMLTQLAQAPLAQQGLRFSATQRQRTIQRHELQAAEIRTAALSLKQTKPTLTRAEAVRQLQTQGFTETERTLRKHLADLFPSRRSTRKTLRSTR
jgi:hypothetical protein